MKKAYLQILICSCMFVISFHSFGQGPQQMFWALNQNQFFFDNPIPSSPSFAYSLRKLKRTYSGYAIKIRRKSDNAEANVSFDGTWVVSSSSNVVVTVAGTGLSVGTVLTLATFSTSAVYVTTWYDQGPNAWHATQTTKANQPRLLLNSSGTGNTLPSIVFSGDTLQYFKVGQGIQNIVASGIRGTFMLALKPTQNINQESFGYWSSTNPSTNTRWSFHINWSDGYFYFDAAEVCCATYRSFLNTSNIGFYKQYTVIRGTSYKTIRVSRTATALSTSAASSITATGGDFYIGWCYNGIDAGFYGNMTEAIMFPTDFSIANVAALEGNQINYWNL